MGDGGDAAIEHHLQARQVRRQPLDQLVLVKNAVKYTSNNIGQTDKKQKWWRAPPPGTAGPPPAVGPARAGQIILVKYTYNTTGQMDTNNKWHLQARQIRRQPLDQLVLVK